MGWLDSFEDGGQFSGLTNEGFNYNGAWGGPAQNGKVIESTGVKKPKTPKLISEDKKLSKAISDEYSFIKQWQNSPKYNEMLKGKYNSESIGKKRKENLKTLSIEVDDVFTPLHFNERNSLADSDALTGNIRLHRLGINDLGFQGDIAHEISHSADRDGYNERLIPIEDRELMRKYRESNPAFKHSNEYQNYLADPTETRARLNELRYNAKKYNIYDPYKESAKPENMKQLEQLLHLPDPTQHDPYKDLREIYTPSQINDMLNKVSDINVSSNTNVQTAQNGKKITVSSKDDPRYKAYQDSLAIYKYGQKSKKLLKDSDTPGEYLEALDNKVKRSSLVTQDVAGEDVEKAFGRLKNLNKKPVSPTSKYSKDFSLLGISTGTGTVPLFKKPNQEVIVDSNRKPKVKQIKKESVKEKTIVPIKHTPLKSIGKLPSVGIQSDFNFGQSEAIHNPTRVPEYYDIEESSNPNAGFGEGYGGTKSMYRTDNPYALPPADNRKVTPRFQEGGKINQELADQAFSFQRGWQDSPMYNQMLTKSTSRTGDYDEIKAGRIDALNRARFHEELVELKDGALGESYPEGDIYIAPKGRLDKTTYDHETSHTTDNVRLPNGNVVSFIPDNDVDYMEHLLTRGLKSNERTDYLRDPSEVRARINSIRADAKNKGIYDPYKEKMTKKQYLETIKKGDATPFLDLEEIYGKRKVLKLINSISDASAPSNNFVAADGTSMPGSVGFSYARTGAPSNGPYAKKTMPSAQSGVVVDDNGYWNPDNWGKVVEIGSNNITMKGVNQPLIGISDTGDTKLMQPGQGYKFKGKKVTEFPIAKNGLTELDQLTNFTNYNKPQKGGWLDQYN